VNPTSYSLDRWYTAYSSGATVSQQSTGAPVGSRYCMRIAYTASSAFANAQQFLETAMAAPLWGNTVTFSVKLRRNASFAANLSVGVSKSSTVDAGAGATWTSLGSTTVSNASLPTATTSADWYTASVTVSVPNDGTANSIKVSIGESATGSSGAYYEVGEAQLELGSYASTFARAGGNIQGELAACQRYFYRYNANGTTGPLCIGAYYTSTSFTAHVPMKQTMRTTPSATFNNPTNFTVYSNGTGRAATALALDIACVDVYSITVTTAAATAGYAGAVNAVNANASIDFSSEL
jgi:hypothetical protein